MLTRFLNASSFLRRNYFLWGPRQTGKSTLLRSLFPDSPYYDLLDSALFGRLVGTPDLIAQELLARNHTPTSSPIIIDEVQKLPGLLDEIHRLIERYHWRFVLCGSSSRKLMRGGGNLLGGRVLRRDLLPLIYSEIPDFSLERALNHGLLPCHYLDNSPQDLIAAYVGIYLREEILAESVVRSLPSFQRFLHVAALSNGQPIQFASIAREVGLSAPGVRGYFEVLVDTLFGGWVPAYQKRQKRRVVAAPRFYFFDVAVVNDLARRSKLLPGSAEFGAAFEHFIYMDLHARRSYTGENWPLSYWRTSSGTEVDFILGDGATGIEVKSTDHPVRDHLAGLRAWKQDNPTSHCILVCRVESARRTEDGIEILPWQQFLDSLWAGKIRT